MVGIFCTHYLELCVSEDAHSALFSLFFNTIKKLLNVVCRKYLWDQVLSFDIIWIAMFLLQVSQSNLRDLLLQCCMDDGADIRQSAFALLGDLARVCWEYSKLFLLSLVANYDLYYFCLICRVINSLWYVIYLSVFIWDSLCLTHSLYGYLFL